MLDDPYVQVALQALPSPDCIRGPEEPQSPPLLAFVPEPVYPEYMPQEDEVFLTEEQPLPAAASPTAQSPDYVSESDPREDPKEDDDEDLEKDPVDYHADGGDDGGWGNTPLHNTFSTDHRVDRTEVTCNKSKCRKFRADYGFVATMDREISHDLGRDLRYRCGKKFKPEDGQKFEIAVRGKQTEVYTKDVLERLGYDQWYSDAELQSTAGPLRGMHSSATGRRKMAPKEKGMRLNQNNTSAAAATAATTTTVINAQLQAMIDQGVTAILAARDANTNGVDSHNSGTGARRNERATRECTFPGFMKCQPLNFKGTEGVVELTQWIEKMETVFRISNCSVENQIKFSTCTIGNDILYICYGLEIFVF
ncbi:hypothetical protein Tco_0431515 [Tanacetum coccineum]